jgi:peptidylprolyl isomerase/FKBP-type peptidyl-prolyl cis-trans isomerase FklB
MRRLLTLLCVLLATACAKAQPDPRIVAAGQAFLARNAHAPGVHVTASGLQYRILKSGPDEGPFPRPTDEVRVNYEGKLLNGTVFDSTYPRHEPAVFRVDGLIPAWTEALQLMRPGDAWELYAPANLAYGDDGAGPIPPGSVLEFRIELIAINPPA